MASKSLLFLSLCLLLFLQQLSFSAGQDAVRAAYWFPEYGFAASEIDSTLFTHLFCAFAFLDSTTYQLTNISSSNKALFSQFTTTVQLKNPSVKTLLSIGGGRADKAVFASMAAQPVSRAAFIDSSIELARSYGFHGLDLDWEYPQEASHMVILGRLLDEWRSAVATEARSSGKPPLILSAAVSNAPTVDGLKYPIEAVSRSLDWINVMAYDFYGPTWSRLTNSHAALYDPAGQVSGSSGIGAWIEAGLAAKKLVLGLPFYGYSWQLVNPNNHGLLAPANGIGSVGSREDGSIGYKEIKDFISQTMATSVYNATIVCDYCYYGTTWIGYDDVNSISTKVSFAKQRGLLGYFAWHVAVDNNWALSKQAQEAWGLSLKTQDIVDV